MKNNTVVRFLTLALILFSALSLTWAQSLAGGAIEGIVTDASGAVVPDVKVTVVNTANGAKQETVTSSDGLFRLLVLPAGSYDLTASKDGFATVQQKAVTLSVGGKLNLPISMPE